MEDQKKVEVSVFVPVYNHRVAQNHAFSIPFLPFVWLF